MADSKVTALTATTSPATTDLVYVVVDPGGTPLSRKCTIANIKTAMTIDQYMPWGAVIRPPMGSLANTNFSTVSWDSSSKLGYLQSSGAQNAEVSWKVALGAGTWRIDWITLKANNAGIYTVYLDATSVGTGDAYNGSTTYNNPLSITEISVAASAIYTLKFKMETKNGSSSAYYGFLEWISLTRTA
jgi:hypothetical protein